MLLKNDAVVVQPKHFRVKRHVLLFSLMLLLAGLFVVLSPFSVTQAALRQQGWRPAVSNILAAKSLRGKRALARLTGGRVFGETLFFGPTVGLTKAIVPASPTAIETGTVFKYRLSWRCAGSVSPQDDCFDMKITDVLPAGIELVNAPVAAPIVNVVTSPSGAQQLVTINFEPIVAAGVAGIIDLDVRYVLGATLNGASSTNTANIQAKDQGGSTVSGVSNSVTTTAVAGDQTSAAKTLSYGGAAGDLSAYTIRVCADKDSNGQGYLDYTNVTITDTLQAGAEFVSASPAPASTSGGVIVWNVAKINGSCQNFNVVVRYPSPTFTAGISVTNNVTVTGTLIDSTVVTYTPSITHQLAAPGPDSSVGKSASSADKGAPDQTVGNDINYTINISNTGNVTEDQLIEDVIPNALNVNRINTGAAASVDYQKNGVNTWIAGVALGSAMVVNGTNFPTFGGGDYVSRLRFRFNNVTPTSDNSVVIRATVINPPHGGGASSLPFSLNNTASVQTIHNNTVVSTKTDAVNFEIVPPTPTIYPQASKSVVSGNQSVPGSIITFRIGAQAGDSTNTTTFFNPVLADLLPANLQFIQTNTITQNGGATGCTALAPAPQVIANYNGTGRSMLVWDWTGSSPKCTLPPGGGAFVEFQARVKEATAFGNYSNVVAVVDVEPPTGTYITKKRFCGATSGQYPDDAAGANGVVIDPAYKCETDPVGFEILKSFQVASRKGVTGQLNDDANPATDDFIYSGSQNVARTIRGGTMRWSMEITNQGNIPATSLDVIDILPFNLPAPGNSGVGTGQAMGSTWRPFFLTPIDISGAPPGTKVYYSADANPCRPDIVSASGCQAMTTNAAGVPQSALGQWSDVFPPDPTIIRSIRLVFGNYVLNPGTTFRFEWPMSAPDDAPLATNGTDTIAATSDDTNIAWNTFGYSATRTDTSENVATAPTRVGIEVRDVPPNLASYGNYVWQDVNRNGIQDEPLTGAAAKGINGVRVELWTDADGNPATTGDQAIFGVKLTANDAGGNPGYYLFPGLQPGNYFARFYPPSDYLAASPANATGDTQDSDGVATVVGTQTVFQSHITALSANQNYVDTDQGFYYLLISVGNTVWLDTDNDGQIDVGEAGKDGVLVELFRDSNSSGALEDLTPLGGLNEFTPVARQLTSGGGYYLFTQRTDAAGVGFNTPLVTGRYIAGISPCNFATTAGCPATINGQAFTTGLLKGYLSSGVSVANNGTITDNQIAGNGTTDSNGDNYDDGARQTTGGYSGGVLSGVLVFTALSDEPVNENTRGLGANGQTPGLNNTVDGTVGGQPIADSDSNVTVDFGFYTQCLGNLVFQDEGPGANFNSGTFDSGEIALSGVTVRLYSANNGTEIRVGPDGILGTSDDATGGVSTTALTSGNYQFCGLPQGSYVVRVTAPTGYHSSVDAVTTGTPNGNHDSEDNGTGRGAGSVVSATGGSAITLTPGAAGALNNNTVNTATASTTHPTLDFGLVRPPTSIGNTVWFDTDNDGQIDAGEQGKDGVRVELFFDADNNGSLAGAELTPVAVQTTSGGGYYLFTQRTDSNGVGSGVELYDGRFFVGVAPSNFQPGGPLAGYHSSATTISNAGVLSDATANTANDTDNADDGQKQFSAPFYQGGVLSPEIILDAGSEPASEATTNSGLSDGTTPGHLNTVNGLAGGKAILDADSNVTVDFGFYTQCMGDVVFADDGGGTVAANFNNGAKDASEGGLTGATVRLFAADGSTEIPVGPDLTFGTADDAAGTAITTTSTGLYQFCGLPQGKYVVKVTPPAGYQSSSDPASGATPSNNTNDDDNGTGTALTQTASALNAAAFTLTPGTTVGAVVTTDNAAGKTTNTTLDFGFAAAGLAIGNMVWFDTNNDGVRNAGTDVGKDGVLVELFLDADNNDTLTGAEQTPVARQLTTSGGYYLFTQQTDAAGAGTGDVLAPGKYYVGISPYNFIATGAPATMGGAAFTGGTLAGYQSSVTTISNAGVITDGVSATADNADDGIKATSGFYAQGVLSAVINLAGATQPVGESTNGGAADGSTPGHLATVTGLAGGPVIYDFSGNVTVDFGFYKQCLGDVVFHDDGAGTPANANNGQREAGEAGIGGIVVKLYAQDGTTEVPVGPDGVLGTADDATGVTNQITTSNSGSVGAYQFCGLPQGQYIVKITAPGGATSSADAGTTGTPDNYENSPEDDNGLGQLGGTVASNPITLAPGMVNATESITADNANGTSVNPTLDFALILTPPVSIGNTVWFDTNNNGAIDAGEQGRDGVLVELFFDADGGGALTGAERTPLARQLTSGGGYYLFTQQTDAAGAGTGARLGASSTGRYFVGISPYNFSTGLANPPATIGGAAFTPGLLAGYLSSGTTIANNGVLTDATLAANTDTDGDNVDDGNKQNAASAHSFYAVANVYGVLSGALLVNVNSEPSAALSNAETTLPANLSGGVTPPNNPALGYPNGHFNTVGGTAAGQPIQDDESNVTVDFGFYRQCLGDVVFSDDGGGMPANYDNGIRNAGENGLKDVVVLPFAADGVTELPLGPDHILGTADDATGVTNQITTGATGAYQFCGLPAGGIIVKIVVPLGYKSSADAATTANPNNYENTPEDDNGLTANEGTIASAAITLTPGTANATEGVTASAADGTTSNPTLDFGCRPQGLAIGNTVWHDADNDGQIDATEQGINGVKVELFFDVNNNNTLDAGAEQTPLATVLTRSGGYYLFTQTTDAAGVGTSIPILPGKYFVGIAPSNFTSPGVLAGFHSSATVANTAGAPVETAVAANQTTDNDRDNYDDGLKAAAGFYTNGVLSGVLNLVPVAEPQNETTAGLPGAAGGNTPGFFNTIDGTVNGAPVFDFNSNITVDFGFYTLSLGNFVFEDRNNNGKYEGADLAFPNLNLRLFALNGTAQMASTASDAQGRYVFTGLLQGSYLVEIDVPAGWVSSKDWHPLNFLNDPDDNLDSDDNGVGADYSAVTARSRRVTLAPGTEPTGESDNAQPINGVVITTPDAASNFTLDFGLTRVYSLGNRIWRDIDNNGQLDAADGPAPGLDNVRVRLLTGTSALVYNVAGELVAEQLTRNGGYYRFDYLPAGNYVVEVLGENFQEGRPLYTLLTSTGAAAPTGPYEVPPDPDDPSGQGVDGDDNGIHGAAVRSYAITLGNDGTQGSDNGHSEPGNEPDLETPNPAGAAPDDQTNLTVDFGFLPQLRLGNLVWKDMNDNGTRDAGEPGVYGVVMQLYLDNGDHLFNAASDTLVQTRISDSLGFYEFTTMFPGNYFVHLPAENFAGNAALDLCYSSSLTEADPDANLDNNDNGVNSATPQTTGITSGEITLQSNTEPDVPDDENNRQGNSTLDFGFYKPLTIGNLVWKDVNNDGLRNAGEPGIDGVQVELFLDRNQNGTFEPAGGDAPVYRTTLTANGGLYAFSELMPGDYFVRLAAANFQAPNGTLAGCTSSTITEPNPNNDHDHDDNGLDDPAPQTNGVASGKISVTANAEPDTAVDGDGKSGNLTVDFGIYGQVGLGNLVWKDNNNDGLKQPNEPGIDGVTVELFLDRNGNNSFDAADAPALRDTVTAGGGAYYFNGLLPGNYFVRIAAANFVAPNGRLSDCVSSTISDPQPNNDEDSDDNGVDDSAPQTNGITSGVVTLTTFGEPANDGDDSNTNATVDFGFYPVMTLGNLVWKDANNDGLRQLAEPGIDGVQVELFRDNGDGLFNTSGDTLVQTQTTAGGGLYRFTGLLPGDYFVRLPAANFNGAGALVNCLSSTPTINDPNTDADNDDNGFDTGAPPNNGISSGKVTLIGDSEPDANVDGDGHNGNLTVDFGFYAQLCLGNLVWRDYDNSGTRQFSEPGIDGVAVDLYLDRNHNGVFEPEGADAPRASQAFTTNGGQYKFCGLLPGGYFVRLAAVNFVTGGVLKDQLSSTVTSPAPNNDVDNDDNGLDAATPETAGLASGLITLAGGSEPDTPLDGDDRNSNLTVDFGFYPPLTLGNLVWKDLNNDGLRQTGLANSEPGVNGVVVELLRDANGNGVLEAGEQTASATKTTAGGGFYLFTGLAPGKYFVRVAATNFAANGALFACNSSTVTEALPDTDRDNDDNGPDNPTPQYGGVTSGVVMLSGNTEPDTNVDGDGRHGNLTVDFGFTSPVSLGNLVFKDQNNNGQRDAGETGIDGVTVELLADANNNTALDNNELTAVATLVTAGGGQYKFTNLTPGNYFVRIAASNFLPNGQAGGALLNCFSSTVSDPTPNNNEDNDDNGIDNATPQTGGITSGVVSLQPGTEPPANVDGDDTDGNATVDFGFYAPLTLGNLVWKDYDNDGLKGAGEPGVDGVTVELFTDRNNNQQYDAADAPALASQPTAGGGLYQFSGLLPGNYFVRVAPGNFAGNGALAGCVSSTPSDATPNNDEDNDDNGLDNANPAVNGIASGLITLSGGGEPSTDGDDNNGNQTVDFGFYAPLRLGNVVWKDFDNNGRQDAGEPGVNGVVVELLRDANGNGALDNNEMTAAATQTTAGGGVYQFAGLAPGKYFVRVAASNFQTAGQTNGALAGCLSSTPTSAAPNDNVDKDDNGVDNPNAAAQGITSGVVTLLNQDEPDTNVDGDDRNGNLTVDFGFTPTLTLGNLVWKDYDNDGQRDAGEPGVDGVVVELFRDVNHNGQLDGPDGGALASRTTAGGGLYKFENLLPDTYLVRLAANNFGNAGALFGCVSSTPTSATPDNNTDNDDNGLDNANPQTNGILSGPVTLSGEAEPNTPVDGDGTNGNLTVDFGFYTPLRLGNLVWKDFDNNGRKDASEPGVNGVVVELLRDANSDGKLDPPELTPVATRTTAGGGLYVFDNLTPGKYAVRLPAANFQANGALAGCLSSTPTSGDPNDNVDNDDNGPDTATPESSGIVTPLVDLISFSEPVNDGDDSNGNLTVDLGFIPRMALGNFVWKDLNNNGGKDANEPVINGVVIELLRDANNNGQLEAGELTALATQTTANGGLYKFENLTPGSYFVRVAASNFQTAGQSNGVLAGCLSSTPTENDPNGDGDTNDNGLDNPNPQTNGILSGRVTLVGESEPPSDGDNNNGNLTVDFGFTPTLRLGNLVWKDFDNNGLRDAGEPGVDGVAVELFRDLNSNNTLDGADGAALATQTTAGGGLYQFTGLLPGSYFVRVAASNFAAAGTLNGCLSSTVTANDPNSNLDNDDNGLNTGAPASTGVASNVINLSGGDEPDTAVDGDDRNGNQTVDFGFYAPLALGNLVWKDWNNDGVRQPGEPAVNNVLLELFRDVNGNQQFDAGDGAALATQTTVNGGLYKFTNLTPGGYFVRVSPLNFAAGQTLAGCFSSTPANTANEANPNSDLDNDDNGLDSITPQVNGILTNLITLSGNAEPDTNVDGDDRNGNMTVDFGFYMPMAVGNLVWKDFNNDGWRQDTEPGIDSVRMELFRDVNHNLVLDAGDGAALATKATTGGGYYQFTGLKPDAYFVRVAPVNFQTGGLLRDCFSSQVTQPDVNTDRDDDDNGMDDPSPESNGICSSMIQLVSFNEPINDGDDDNANETVDFGFTSTNLRLGNLVWKDKNRNGRREAEEPGIANVTLNLYRDNGNLQFEPNTDQLIGSTQTNASGLYGFNDLLPGNYFVRVAASNFASGAVLNGCASSADAANPNNDVDNDDNGSDSLAPAKNPPVSGLVTLSSGSEPTVDGDDNNGNQTVDFGFVTLNTLTVEDPATCLGPGTQLTIHALVTNASLNNQPDNPGPELVAALPASLSGVPGSCTITGGAGTCTVTATQMIFEGSIPAGVTLEAVYKVQIAAGVQNGTQFCITSTANFDADINGTNESATSIQYCDVVNCQQVGPGLTIKSGCSVLIYPVYTSSASDPNVSNTRVTLTNTHQTEPVAVHLFFVDGTSCSVSDSYLCLTQNQTSGFLLSDIDPGTTGYLIAVAVNSRTGCPINFNYLIGEAAVKFDTGHWAQLPAECSVAIIGDPAQCNANQNTATLNFNADRYSSLPRAVAVDSLGSRLDGNDPLLVLARIGGNLSTSADRLGPLFGLLYDDAERGVSFSFNPGTCQLRARLDNNFPRTTPRYEQLIPAGRTGWMRLWASGDEAIVGAVLNRNPAARTTSGAFEGGHPLHTLTLTNSASLTIPVFPPTCQ
jgi:hypothetical protein